MKKKEWEDYLDTLAETARLFRYFDETIDFGLDPYDPLVLRVIALIHESEDFEEAVYSEAFFNLIIERLPKHVTASIRFEIYEHLQAKRSKVKPGDKQLLEAAISALEDLQIDASFIAIVYELFVDYIFDLVDNIYSNRQVADADLVATLLEKAKLGAADEFLRRLDPEMSMALLETAFFEKELDEAQVESLLIAAKQYPRYRSARLFQFAIQFLDWGETEILALCKGSPLEGYLCDCLLDDLDDENDDFLNRWSSYLFLTAAEDYRVVDPLRRELLQRDYWNSLPDADDPEINLRYYQDIVYCLLELKDRRAVPTLIRLFHEGRELGFHTEVIDAVKKQIDGSEWREEIHNALRLLKEGELVFVEKGLDFADAVPQEAEKYAELHSLIAGNLPELSEMQDHMKMHEKRWNEAYHEDLDGLRPIDIPTPKMQFTLLSRMFSSFQRRMNLGSAKGEVSEEFMQEYQDFQTQWMITPLTDYNNQIPLAMIINASQELSDTYALQQHFQRYKNETIASLYHHAVAMQEAGDIEGAKMNLEAVLAIEPDFPFAKMRYDEIGKGRLPMQTRRKISKELRGKEQKTEVLRPFFPDVVYDLRPGLKSAIAKEISSLRAKGQKFPVFDDVGLAYLKPFVRSFIENFEAGLASSARRFSRKQLELLLQTIQVEYFAVLNFEASGKKVYYFSPELVQQWKQPDLQRSVDGLNLPVSSCAFVFQDEHMLDQFHRCFTDREKAPEYYTPLTVFLAEKQVENATVLTMVITRVALDFTNYGTVKRSLSIPSSGHFEDALRTDWLAIHDKTGSRGKQADDYFHTPERVAFFGTILMAIRYLNSEKPALKLMESPIGPVKKQRARLKSTAKIAKLQRRLDRMLEQYSELSYYFVGENG